MSQTTLNSVRRRMVILDDEPFMLGLLAKIAERAGFEPHGFSSAQEFNDKWRDSAPDLVLLDLGLNDSDGMQILSNLAQAQCAIPILIVTGFDERVAGSAANFGESIGLTMLPPLRKPFEVDEVVSVLRGYASTTFALTADELAEALANKRIEVMYQPVIELATGALVGAESLVFWQHPLYGLVPMDRFLAAAEKGGLLEQLIEEVTCQAFAALAGTDDLTMGIQTPVSILHDERFADTLAIQARAAGLRPNQVMIEITEEAAMRDAVATSSIVTRLRIKGFRVALDDFGLGYSSLIELHKMPVSQINIDQVFVGKAHGDESARTITGAIVGLGHSLRLIVCADGVNDEATRAALVEMGCDLARGAHFAAPMMRNEFVHWARSHRTSNPSAPADSTVMQFPSGNSRPD